MAYLILALSILVVLVIVYFIESKRVKGCAKESIKDLMDEYLIWNETITSREAMSAFYNSLNETMMTLYGHPLRMNLTKDEFEHLSLNTLRELNKMALMQLKDTLE